MDDIFFSYSRKDNGTAERLKECIESQGYSVWLDTEDICGGDLWRKQIVMGIERCRLYVILLTANSICSDNVRRELDLARAKSAPILPVCGEPKPTRIPREMEYQLVGLQVIDETLFDDPRRAQALISSLILPPHTLMMPVSTNAFLEPTDGPAIPLAGAHQIVGRGPQADIDLTNLDSYTFISKRHAEFSFHDGDWFLTASDRASNPTFVNGKSIARGNAVVVKDGDMITFANITFRFALIARNPRPSRRPRRK